MRLVELKQTPRMLPTSLWLLCLTAISSRAQTTSHDLFSTTFSTIPNPTTSNFAGTQYTYISYSGQTTVTTSNGSSSSETQLTRTTTTPSLTQIGGLPNNGTSGTSSSTSSAGTPQNTVPCNNYPEFCNRKYSNITNICSHNSAFAIPNNAGSNQIYGIVDQLNDGVRMLQGETQWVNDTVVMCHTRYV